MEKKVTKAVFNYCYGGFSISEEAAEILSLKKGKKIDTHCFEDMGRDDSDLIALIEERGSEFVSGDCASLSIVEIPEGLTFSWDEYDGMESYQLHLDVTPEELVAGLPQDMVDSVIKHRATIRIKR